MRSGKVLLQNVILKASSRGIQHKLRRFFVARQVMNRQYPKEPEMMLLRSVVSAGDSIADVGANVGIYTRELSSLVGAAGELYSFEPISENYDILETVIRKAHLSNVRSFRAALSSQPGRREMVIPELGGFSGYYWAHFAQDGDSGRREMVDVLTLDAVWNRTMNKRLDFIKCDAEGSELEVIGGGLEVIESQRPGWLLEVSRKASDGVFRLLKDLGYRAFVFDDKLIPTEGYRDKEFSNYFFFHPKSPIWRRVLLYQG